MSLFVHDATIWQHPQKDADTWRHSFELLSINSVKTCLPLVIIYPILKSALSLVYNNTIINNVSYNVLVILIIYRQLISN